MRYVKSSKIEEIPIDKKKKEDVYFDEYINFFNKIKIELPTNFGNKKIDEALWAIGKFLKSYKSML
jgi:histone deacetylase complex regulatory component SIN3